MKLNSIGADAMLPYIIIQFYWLIIRFITEAVTVLLGSTGWSVESIGVIVMRLI